MVGVVCTVWVGRPGILGLIPSGNNILFYPQASRTVLRLTQSPIQFVSELLSRGLKWPVREVDLSFSSSTEVKHKWRNKSTLPYEDAGNSAVS
jgi:thiamine pyrophosphokinase